MTKRLLCAFMAMCLVILMLPAGVCAEGIEDINVISELSLEFHPKEGERARVMAISPGEHINIRWGSIYDSDGNYFNGIYKAGETYYAYIDITPDNGYSLAQFSDYQTLTLNEVELSVKPLTANEWNSYRSETSYIQNCVVEDYATALYSYVNEGYSYFEIFFVFTIASDEPEPDPDPQTPVTPAGNPIDFDVLYSKGNGEEKLQWNFDDYIVIPTYSAVGTSEYYLTEDICVDMPIYVNGDITLDLNGHVLLATMEQSQGSLLNVNSCGALTINDSGVTEHAFTITNSGLWTIEHNIDGLGNLYTTALELEEDTEYMILPGGCITSNHNDSDCGIFCDEGGTVVINDGNIVGNESYYGGGIYNNGGTIVINGGNIIGNYAQCGGAVYNSIYYDEYEDGYDFDKSGTLTINGGLIENNTAACGGGIYNYYSTISALGGSIIYNTAYDDSDYSCGGGICNYGGILTVSGASICSNTSYADSDHGYGGGVYNQNGTFYLESGIISDNYADEGGGIYNYRYTSDEYEAIVNMTGGIVTRNLAFVGGGIANCYGILNLSGGTISSNDADIEISAFMDEPCGGGVCNYGYYDEDNQISYGFVNISGTEIIGNYASFGGGGIYNSCGEVSIAEYENDENITTIIKNNKASYGGGIYNRGLSSCGSGCVTMSAGEISCNYAYEDGAGVYNKDEDGNAGTGFVMTGGEITGNITFTNDGYTCGGGIYNNSGILQIGGSITDNCAVYGGGIYSWYGYVSLFGTVTGNEAERGDVYHYDTYNDSEGSYNGFITVTEGTVGSLWFKGHVSLDGDDVSEIILIFEVDEDYCTPVVTRSSNSICPDVFCFIENYEIEDDNDPAEYLFDLDGKSHIICGSFDNGRFGKAAVTDIEWSEADTEGHIGSLNIPSGCTLRFFLMDENYGPIYPAGVTE